MKIKFLKRPARWLYDHSHERTIDDYERIIRILNDKVKFLEDKNEKLKKMVDAGEVEMRVVERRYYPVKVQVEEKMCVPWGHPELDATTSANLESMLLERLGSKFARGLIMSGLIDLKVEHIPQLNEFRASVCAEVLKKEN